MSAVGVSSETLAKYKAKFDSDPKNKLAQNVCTRSDIFDNALCRTAVSQLNNVFTNKLSLEGKPVTNQKSSGRCWIFACLNCIRIPIMKKLNLEELEFSQTYLFFWDKIERANYMLHAFLECARRGETAEGRLVYHLLQKPTEDGGQWDMLVNLIEKHGIIPKKCFPETFSSESSRRLGALLNNKHREFCCQIQKLVAEGKSEVEIKKEMEKMLEEVYNITRICLGTPPETFTWEYYNKNKEYQKIGPISPRDFYIQHIKPVYNMEDKVVIVNDPRPDNPYNKMYTVEFLGNMVGGQKTLYNNQPIEVLKKVAAESIKADEAVWYGCDVGKHFQGKMGVNHLHLHDFELLFGSSMLKMSKADRLIYSESLMTHAMVLTGVTAEGDGFTKWRVENSWGEEGEGKGYLVMTDDWFSEFVFEVVVDKKFIPQEVLAVLTEEPKVLPAWDPMGALATEARHQAKL